ncbi:MAG: hypothetical protein ACR2PS_14300 [Pseudomonadales bacterium]
MNQLFKRTIWGVIAGVVLYVALTQFAGPGEVEVALEDNAQ